METGPPPPEHRHILGMRVDATSYANAAEHVLAWSRRRESRYVCVANVHMTMEAHDMADFRRVVNGADLVTPDGMPLVWVLRRLGLRDQTRVYGPELTLRLCELAACQGVPVGFYGGSPQALQHLVTNMARSYPGLDVAYSSSPPFRPLTPEEDRAEVEAINAAGSRILFVGLGCPKQERWMAARRGRVQAVMLGVGAAFDIHSGRVKQAPRALQAAGLEWSFRLLTEPRRLWRRYAKHNPRFLALVAIQLLRSCFTGRIPHPPRPGPP